MLFPTVFTVGWWSRLGLDHVSRQWVSSISYWTALLCLTYWTRMCPTLQWVKQWQKPFPKFTRCRFVLSWTPHFPLSSICKQLSRPVSSCVVTFIDLSKILLIFHFHIHHFKLYWCRPGFWLQASKCDDDFFLPICLLSFHWILLTYLISASPAPKLTRGPVTCVMKHTSEGRHLIWFAVKLPDFWLFHQIAVISKHLDSPFYNLHY